MTVVYCLLLIAGGALAIRLAGPISAGFRRRNEQHYRRMGPRVGGAFMRGSARAHTLMKWMLVAWGAALLLGGAVVLLLELF